MVSCGQFKMLPMVPTADMAMPPSSKPKIGFSIDSIVGSSEFRGHGQDSSLSPRSESPDRPSSSLSDCDYSYPLELRNSEPQHINTNQIGIRTNRGQAMLSSDFHRNCGANFPEPSPNSEEGLHKSRMMSENCPRNVQSPLSPEIHGTTVQRTPSPPIAHRQHSTKGPIVVPGIPAGLIRPFPVQPPNIGEVKQMPSYLSSPEIVGSTNPHFLAAQFQMAAALAHGQAGQGFNPGSGLPQHHPQFNNPNIVRDSYPLYPWLISRHGRIFPHRFPGTERPNTCTCPNRKFMRHLQWQKPLEEALHGQIIATDMDRCCTVSPVQVDLANEMQRMTGKEMLDLELENVERLRKGEAKDFLLQPFRKPKRVRTAFSPSQLLKLEHAFESNHYVVGAERKTLAQVLSLTETQVKVWFQNRRTKHKRMQQEEDAKNCGSGSSGNGGTGVDQKNLMGDSSSSTQASFEEDDEDELIDMDDCPSDQEGDQIQ